MQTWNVYFIVLENKWDISNEKNTLSVLCSPAKSDPHTLACHPSLSVWLWLFDAVHTWLYSKNLLFSWRSVYRPHASRRAGYSRSPASWVLLIDRLIDIFLLIEAHKSPVLRGQDKVSNMWNENTGRWQIFMTTSQILTIPKWVYFQVGNRFGMSTKLI